MQLMIKRDFCKSMTQYFFRIQANSVNNIKYFHMTSDFNFGACFFSVSVFVHYR